MRVLIVGGGGREHSLAIGLSGSPSVDSIHTAPGNAGTGKLGVNHDIGSSDIEGLVGLAREIEADLVVVGPEAPLVLGLADKLREIGIPCFGPHSEGAMLEGSKLHAKNTMIDLGVPTGRCQVIEEARDISNSLDSFHSPWVIKRDVLAGGKGVTVTSDRDVAERALSSALDADGMVLMEEHLDGEEASVLVVMDETGFVCLPPSQDHKRAFDGDRGPNTGGMGAYAPAPVVTPSVMKRVVDEVVGPMHHHLRNQKIPYRGCLYAGLMIDEEGAPRVIEFNVRFGDPETQVTVPLIDSDLGELLLAAAEGSLSSVEPSFSGMSAATVVLASEGYPESPITGGPISGSEASIDEGETRGLVHFAGTKSRDGILVSSGGRVLAATGIAPSLEAAVSTAYEIIENIDLQGSHYRSDIGHRALRR
ncbi:MAG: phosphoribosylamine--glycine ligase [Euryarchaeota archaeon]|nr:phosphoribosylamine--glycine ligase [Euryarchaeota archaeon]|tara:strand:+ start:5163 stop:6425 length:1263 start_codon:yes stop_codon:yes gene_type:complete